jgi:hypothetical protein
MSPLTLASSRRLPLGDILQRLAGLAPCHLAAIDVVVRDVWEQCTPSSAPRRHGLRPVARPFDRVDGAPAVRTDTRAVDAAALEDCRQTLERIVRSELFRAAVTAAEQDRTETWPTTSPKGLNDESLDS